MTFNLKGGNPLFFQATGDICFLRLPEGKQVAIFFILDEFSRLLRARIIPNRRLATIKAAFFRFYGTHLPFCIFMAGEYNLRLVHSGPN